MSRFERRDILFSYEEIEKIEKSRLMIVGLGGVGGYTLEALARMGINDFVLVDGDVFDLTNINRQILSTTSSIGRKKVEVAKERIISINPDAKIKLYSFFVDEKTINELDFNVSYIVDLIDDCKAKVLLAKEAKRRNIPIISMMGAGNRITASFLLCDIYKTECDPLSKKMRQLYKEAGISDLKVVYTLSPIVKNNKSLKKENVIGSISYVVGQAGLKVAEEVLKDILNK